MKNFYQSLLVICALLGSCFSHAQVPIHNSYPAASATIFLDFDGQTVENTSWNWTGPLNLGAANMTSAQITEVFNRVSEDFRPFNINVTTDSTVYWAAPAARRMRVILTVSSSWYGAAGGVAYVNSFTWGDNTPCFVFTALLGYNAKYVAEAASHEAGHTLGLRHQSSYDGNCVKTAEYNPGIGSGEIAWAPIMGVGYYRNFTLWNNGANPYGCTVLQDDLGIITSTANGFGYRADDHANSAGGSATAAVVSNNQFNVNGIIERISDKDHFKFTLSMNSQLQLMALPYQIGTSGSVGSNLDLQVTLMSSSNNVIGIYNPQSTLDLFIDTFLLAGNYFIKVEGKGNTFAPEYASLGSYNLNATLLPFGVLPVRAIELSARKENQMHLFNWLIDADEKILKQELQLSLNGFEFNTVGKFSADARSFAYPAREDGRMQYRLHVVFESGAQYYSNQVTLENHTVRSHPALESNLVTANASVQSPGDYDYVVADLNGRIILRGQLTRGRNTISTSAIPKGIYVVRYYNGSELLAEKLAKQ